MPARRLRALLLSPGFDATDTGEAFVSYKWAAALADRVELTVLALQRHGRPPLAGQLPGVEVVTWPEPAWLLRFERFNAMLKPAYPLYMAHVRRWIRAAQAAGRRFDIAHQIMPQAARYPSPLRGAGIPYLIGPLGGALTTPESFQAEAGSARWYTRLRALDAWRFARDPWLRASYAGAEAVLGVAPYMRDLLAAVPIRRFEPVLELGIDDLPPLPDRSGRTGLRLLHVGRGVRTKGLRDAVRALARLADLPGITLTSAGEGEEIALCRAEAGRLGIADRVTFLGRVPRAEVEALYRDSDVFLFPSFREPAGNVLYEAMRWGLPVITARRGGPEFVTDDSCAIRVEVTEPGRYAADIAEAVRRLHGDPALRARMGRASRDRVAAEGLWPHKAERLVALYRDLLATRA